MESLPTSDSERGRLPVSEDKVEVRSVKGLTRGRDIRRTIDRVLLFLALAF